MSLILGINTASKKSAIALLADSSVLGEQEWISNADESVKLLPAMLKLLEEHGKRWVDLTHVFVVKGPGAYTSLRVGITIANSMAWFLKIPMISADVFEIWENRIPEDERIETHQIAVAAGRDRYLLRGQTAPRGLKEIGEIKIPCYGELPKDFEYLKDENLMTFGEALSQMDLENRKSESEIMPFYIRPPDITTPKKK